MNNYLTDGDAASRILESLPVGVFGVNTDYRICFVNHMAENLLGRSMSLVKQKKLDEILSPGSDLEKLVRRSFDQGGSMSAKGLKVVGPMLNVQTVDASASREADLVIVSLAPAHVTGEVDPNDESATMAEVARILGHEVKNPLAGMLGAAQLLARKARPDQQALLTLIREEGDRIGRILDRFVAFETFFHPRLCETNVHRVIRGVIDLCQASYASEINIVANFDPSLPEIQADPDHLHEALLNLIKNACEAIEESGKGEKIEITTRYRLGMKFLGNEKSSQNGGAFEISIHDDGPGIPTELRDRIFSPFFTTRESGNGVGLAVVAEIVKAHDGKVEVESDNSGTRFNIVLPIGSLDN